MAKADRPHLPSKTHPTDDRVTPRVPWSRPGHFSTPAQPANGIDRQYPTDPTPGVTPRSVRPHPPAPPGTYHRQSPSDSQDKRFFPQFYASRKCINFDRSNRIRLSTRLEGMGSIRIGDTITDGHGWPKPRDKRSNMSLDRTPLLVSNEIARKQGAG